MGFVKSFIAVPVVFSAILWLADAAAESKPRPPNVVLIVADYMGASDIGPYGTTDIATPFLDAMAAKGVVFTNSYAAAPICGPSRAALMTGQYPARIGFEENIDGDGDERGLSEKLPTLPSLLKERGYNNGLFGKWHLGGTKKTDPIAHGFDEFLGYYPWSINYYTHRNDSGEEALMHNRSIVEREGYLTDILTDESIRFMKENVDKPFFAYVSYNTALPPYLGPDLPPDQWDVGFDIGDATREDYVSMVEAMDTGIGRILATLDDLGISDNTLVIFTYDHNGRQLVRNAPFSGGFAMLNEGGIRVPLIMQWPNKLPAGERLDNPVINMDVTATILTAAGFSSESLNLDGHDLVEGRKSEEDREFFWRIKLGDFGQAAVRRDNWKLLVHKFSTFSQPSVYLYDLENDPGESIDLYYKKQDFADRLYSDLIDWETSVAGSTHAK